MHPRHNPHLLLLVSLIPILIFGALITCCAIDVPYWDDFDAILGALNNFSSSDSISDRASTLIALHNEHRLGVLRAFSVATLVLFGQIDFAALTILGNLGLVVLLIALYQLTKDKFSRTSHALLVVCCAFLIFQPQFYDTPLWPTVSLSNFSVVYFAALTFLFLERLSWPRFVLALGCGVLGLFSQGNGILILPLALVFLLVRREFAKGAVWAVIAAALLAIYFYGFTPGHGAAGAFNLWRILDSGLTFLGAAPAFGSHKLAFAIGTLLILAFGWVTYKQLYRKAPGIFLFLIFLLLSVGLCCIGRPDQDAAIVLLQPRYKFISIVIFATSLIAIVGTLEQSDRKQLGILFAKGSLVASILFWIGAYATSADNVFEIRDTLLRSAVKWNLTRDGLYYPVSSAARELLERSERLGIYELSATQMAPLVFNCAPSSGKATGAEGAQFNIDSTIETPEYLYLDGWALPQSGRSLFQSVAIELIGSERSYRCQTRTMTRPDVRNAFGTSLALRSGFAAVLPMDDLAPDSYAVFLELSSSGKDWSINTGKSINISKLASANSGT